MTCDHTGVTIPECSCYKCCRELHKKHVPEAFPGEREFDREYDAWYESRKPSDTRAIVWHVVFHDRAGRLRSTTVAAEHEDEALTRVALDENISIAMIETIYERKESE